MNAFDETPGVAADNPKESNPSKFLLWQDVLTGLYDFNIRGLALNEHYARLAERLYFDAPWVMSGGTLGRASCHRTVSASPFSG